MGNEKYVIKWSIYNNKFEKKNILKAFLASARGHLVFRIFLHIGNIMFFRRKWHDTIDQNIKKVVSCHVKY
jgi:hypothetical protein